MSTKVKGYKGHRVGSKAEKAHKLVDENPKAERKDLVGKIKRLGVSDVTAGHWFSVFRNWAAKTKPAVVAKKEAAKKPAVAKGTKTKAAPVKKPAVAKTKATAPVIKKTPATAAAAPTQDVKTGGEGN